LTGELSLNFMTLAYEEGRRCLSVLLSRDRPRPLNLSRELKVRNNDRLKNTSRYNEGDILIS